MYGTKFHTFYPEFQNLKFLLKTPCRKTWINTSTQESELVKYSVGVIYLVILNLPREERYKLENIIDEITFLDLCLYKGERFAKEGILDIKTHIKPTNTQQYVHASFAHPPGTGWGIIKGEILRYLRTNSNEATFQTHKEKHVENMKKEDTDKRS